MRDAEGALGLNRLPCANAISRDATSPCSRIFSVARTARRTIASRNTASLADRLAEAARDRRALELRRAPA